MLPAPPLQHQVHLVRRSLPRREDQEGWAESHIPLCCAACPQVPVLGVTLASVSTYPSNLQDLPLLVGSFLQPRSSPFQDHLLSKTTSYRNPSFQSKSFFPNPQFSCFPILNSLHAETQHMISLLISGSVLCLLINWRIQGMPLSFSPDADKIYKQPISVAASM